ncbi:hypothetical protein Fmac_011493 [Flemingia macrophylla]|uniref:Polygalacturonase n=1 Tax=Flemingia macrophylla TaxID=520843 RepID=A0ABD1MML1_9FABA
MQPVSVAVGRSFAAVYNVLDFGAAGDGKTNDSHSFLKAWQLVCGTHGINTLLIPSGRVFLVENLGLNGTCMATSISIQVLAFQSCNNLRVRNLKTINSPQAHIHVNQCVGAIFSYLHISAPGDSPNTDGIDIYDSKYINIEDSIIGTGDDCIAISGDSSFINATRIACGPGHGISIGSLGRENARNIVEEVHVQNCSFTNTENGARIKTWTIGSGYARKITFEQITLTKTQNPIIIDQYYTDSEKGGVQVSEVTYRGFRGTSYNDQAITLNCSSSGCYNIVLDQNNIVSSEPGKPAYCSCLNAHGTATSTVPNCSCLIS